MSSCEYKSPKGGTRILQYTPLSWMGKYSLAAYVLHISWRAPLAHQVSNFLKFRDSWIIPNIQVALEVLQPWCEQHGFVVSIVLVMLLVLYPMLFMLTCAPLFHKLLMKIVD